MLWGERLTATDAAAERVHVAFAAARESIADSPGLEQALKEAVEASKMAFAALEQELEDVLTAARPLDPSVRPAWDRHAEAIRSALSRRSKALSSFRIVLFGRTGAGKSSFVEALSRGSGRSVSTGESDYTTTCREVRWGDCMLVDTPGIEGWGREVAPQDLEAEARRALDTADLVVLAFDTQNQKAGEFDKVADWVLEFDKPVLALLNVRNSHWRRRDKEPDPERLSGQALSVAENAQHVRDALSASGLSDNLPVAVNIFNAVAGRCPDYTGPNASVVHAMRERFGATYLQAASNFAVIEALLKEVLTSAALDLRLQSIANDVRHRLSLLAGSLRESRQQALEGAEQAEARIDLILAVIGPGSANDGVAADRKWHRRSLLPSDEEEDRLTRLEQLRGRPFGSDTLYGRVWDAWDDHSSVRLDTASIREAGRIEDAIRDAFTEGTTLTEQDVQAWYGSAGQELCQAAEQALQGVLDDLKGEFDTVSKRLAVLAMNSDAPVATGVDGGRGTAQRNAARALNLAALGVVFVPVPGVNLLVAAGVRGVGQVLFSVFSRRNRASAERARASELHQALLGARNAVTLQRDAVSVEATEQLRAWTTSLANMIIEDVDEAIAMRAAAEQYARSAEILNCLRQALPEQGAGTAGLIAARDRMCETGPVDSPTDVPASWRQLALGELLAEGEQVLTPPLQSEPPQTLPAALTEPASILGRQLQRLPEPPLTDTQEWLSSLEEDSDHAIRAVVPPGDAERGRASLVLTGPAGVGTRSLIRALEVHALRPGESKVDLRHADDADLRALATSDAVALVLPPSLFGGADDLAGYLGHEVLAEDTRSRLILVLTRIDELAVDPDEAPGHFAAAVERKLVEVRRYAARLELPENMPVVAVAAAPWGLPLQGSGPWWAGVDRLGSAFDSGLAENSGRASTVRGVIGRLQELLEETGQRLADQELPQRESVAALRRSLEIASHRGERLEQQLPAELTRELERVVMPLAFAISGASSHAEVVAAQEALNEWRATDEVDELVRGFETRACVRVEEWLRAVGRALAAQEWSAPGSREQPGATMPRERRHLTPIKVLAESARRLAGQLGKHDAYYKLGKDLGHKFRPWEAVKGAQRVRNVTPALGVLTVGLAAVELWSSERAEKQLNDLRGGAPKTAREDIRDFVDQYLSGHEDSPGLLRVIAEARAQLEVDGVEASETVEDAVGACESSEMTLQSAQNAQLLGLRLLDANGGGRR